jgi:hypothetical protein
VSDNSKRINWYYYIIIFLLLGGYLILHYRGQEGWYQWEKLGPEFRYRWTKKAAQVRIAVEGPVIGIPLSAANPDIEKKPLRVTLFIDGQFIDQIVLRNRKWQTFDYLIPDPEKKYITLKFKVNRTWSPLETIGSIDERDIGVAVGPFSWKAWKIGSMVGFYDRETGENGMQFRWTRKQASIMLAVKGTVLSIPIQAVHPHMGRNPVKVEVFMADKLWDTAILEKGGRWEVLEYKLPSPDRKPLKLTFKIDRTWSPLEAKFNDDPRDIGVAIGKISWKD